MYGHISEVYPFVYALLYLIALFTQSGKTGFSVIAAVCLLCPKYCLPMNAFHAFVVRISRWYVWLFFLLSLLFFSGYVMPRAATNFMETCGPGTQMPETVLGYKMRHLQQMLAAMDEPCRAVYKHNLLVPDGMFPLAYGFFFFFSIVILHYKGPKPSAKRGAYFIPLACIVADYLENFSLAYLMDHPADYSRRSLFMATFFSGIKWFLFFASVGAVLLGVVYRLRLRFGKKGG